MGRCHNDPLNVATNAKQTHPFYKLALTGTQFVAPDKLNVDIRYVQASADDAKCSKKFAQLFR